MLSRLWWRQVPAEPTGPVMGDAKAADAALAEEEAKQQEAKKGGFGSMKIKGFMRKVGAATPHAHIRRHCLTAITRCCRRRL